MDVRRHATARPPGRCSARPGSKRRRWSARWGGAGSPSRSWRSCRRRPAPRSRRTPTGSTPVRRHTPARSRCSTILNAGGLDYRPRALDAGRLLAWLKAMAWDLRGNATGEIDRVLRSPGTRPARWPSSTRRTTMRPPADRRQGGVVDGCSSRTRRPQGPANRPSGVHRRHAGALAGLRDQVAEMPLVGPRRRAWAATAGWSTARTATGAPCCQRPAPRRLAAGVWMQMGLHCRTVSDDCPSTSPASPSPGAGGDGRAQRRHRLGLHQPRPRRERPLPRARAGRVVPLRRPVATAAHPDRDHRGRRRRGPHDHGALDRARAAAVRTCPRRSPTSATTHPGEAGRYAVALAWTALRPTATADAILGIDTGERLGRVPPGGPRPSPYRRRTWCTPTARATSATRRPACIPIRQSGNDGLLPSAGWRPENDWTGGTSPFDGLPDVLDPSAASS